MNGLVGEDSSTESGCTCSASPASATGTASTPPTESATSPRGSTISLVLELLERQDRRCLISLRRTVRRLSPQCVEDFYADVAALLYSNPDDNVYYKLVHLCKTAIHRRFSQGPMQSDIVIRFVDVPLSSIRSINNDTTILDFKMSLSLSQTEVLDLLLAGYTQAEVCQRLSITQHTFLKIRESIGAVWNAESRLT